MKTEAQQVYEEECRWPSLEWEQLTEGEQDRWVEERIRRLMYIRSERKEAS